MKDRAIYRLRDMKKSIERINSLLGGKSFAQTQADPVALAAFERFLEILSEAARHIPEAWQSEHAEIPWRSIADPGNRIRHEYFRVDAAGLWSIYEHDLGPLEHAVNTMLASHDQ